jgi:PAS domain S-box-containing protein
MRSLFIESPCQWLGRCYIQSTQQEIPMTISATRTRAKREASEPWPPLKVPALIGLSIVYVISGKLGLMLALPPGYASAIFPPSGIGVAAVLLGGRAALPWVFASAFLLNLWIGYDLGTQLGWVSISSAALIGLASTLQAAAGGYVLRKIIGYPLLFASIPVLAASGLLSPLVCLISASLSVGSLVMLGVIQTDHASLHWLTWWLGDTLGLLLALPLVLVLLAEPRPLWRARALSVAVPTLLVFALLVSGYALVNRREQRQNLAEFAALAHKVKDEIKLRFDLQESLLDQAQSLFSLPGENGTVTLTRTQFTHFVRNAIERYASIQAIEWAPRVAGAERDQFELAQREDIPSFEIRERDTAGQLQRAGGRDHYQPVTYVAPMRGNEAAIGFDLASNPARREALALSTQTRGTVATVPVRLVQEQQDQAGVLLIQAVKEGPHKDDVVLAVLRMGDFMSQAAAFAESQLFLRLVDVAQGEDLYNTFPGARSQPYLDEAIELGTRQYKLQAAPTPTYVAAHQTWQSWAVLVVGLLSTGVLGGFLLLGTGQKAQAEAIVEERTRELRKRETALANAQKIASVGSWEWDLAKNEMTWSEELYHLFGMAPRQSAQQQTAFLEQVHPEDRHNVKDAMAHALADGRRFQLEHRLLVASGEERIVEQQAVVELDEAGRVRYMMGTVHDITERKKLDRLKNEFISTVSHELRTPLTSIRGAIGLLAGQFADTLPGNVRQMLEIADRNSRQLAALINDLLDLEKIVAGRLVLHMQATDLSALAKRAIEDNDGYARKHDVELVLEGAPENAQVIGDAHRLLQVFANLISNAVKFSPSGGRVEISVAIKDGKRHVTVRDHGSGIPKEFHGRIFGRFAQADSSDSRRKGGTGLGLSITKAIVEAHQGHVGFDETPGGGATFWFELPGADARTHV